MTTPLTGAPLLWQRALQQSTRMGRTLWSLTSLLCILAVWYLVWRVGNFIPYALPSPIEVGETLVEMIVSGEIFKDLGASLTRLVAGVVLGAVTGVIVGALIGVNKHVARSVAPLLTFFNAIGGIAWIPLAILWFGVGPAAILFVIWNSVFFQVTFNTYNGVQQVPMVYRQVVATMGGSRWRILREVLLPGALPSLITGLRTGISFGWRTLIAAEMIGSLTGIGVLIISASTFFRSDRIFAGIVVIGIVWLFMDRVLLQSLERLTIRRWGMTT